VTAIFLTAAPHSLWLLAAIFVFAGVYVGTEEARRIRCAELLPERAAWHGVRDLAAVNAVGGFSFEHRRGVVVVTVSVKAAFFIFGGVCFFAGAIFDRQVAEIAGGKRRPMQEQETREKGKGARLRRRPLQKAETQEPA